MPEAAGATGTRVRTDAGVSVQGAVPAAADLDALDGTSADFDGHGPVRTERLEFSVSFIGVEFGLTVAVLADR